MRRRGRRWAGPGARCWWRRPRRWPSRPPPRRTPSSTARVPAATVRALLAAAITLTFCEAAGRKLSLVKVDRRGRGAGAGRVRAAGGARRRALTARSCRRRRSRRHLHRQLPHGLFGRRPRADRRVRLRRRTSGGQGRGRPARSRLGLGRSAHHCGPLAAVRGAGPAHRRGVDLHLRLRRRAAARRSRRPARRCGRCDGRARAAHLGREAARRRPQPAAVVPDARRAAPVGPGGRARGCIGAVVLADLWPGRWSLWLVAVTAAAAALVHVAAGHPASSQSWWLSTSSCSGCT